MYRTDISKYFEVQVLLLRASLGLSSARTPSPHAYLMPMVLGLARLGFHLGQAPGDQRAAGVGERDGLADEARALRHEWQPAHG